MDTNIPVVILSGGIGSRLKEETEFRPKPMITIGGYPILWHIMKIYQHFGFCNFVIAYGYKGSMIVDYFNKHKPHTMNVTLVDTGEGTLTGERLLRVKRYISTDTFMVTYGDGVGNIDINALVSFYLKKKIIGVITGVYPTSKWGLIVKNRTNIITKFRQKPLLTEQVNGGFMVFSQKVFTYLREKEMIEDAFNRLIKKKQLGVYTHPHFWHAMDTYQDMEELNKLWHTNPEWKVWEK